MHWVGDGIVNLEIHGRVRVRIPRELFVVVNILLQTHTVLLSTVEARAVQYPCDGVALLASACKNPKHYSNNSTPTQGCCKHGAKLTREAPYDDNEEIGEGGD